MSYRVAINGYGRIGRCVLRALFESRAHDALEIVAINDVTGIDTLAHLTRYDSTHGRFPGTVTVDGDMLWIASGGREQSIRILREPDIAALPWRELQVDLVLECSGTFDDRETAERHLDQGAGRVLFSQPARPDVDATIVHGINDRTLRPENRIISAASCTTNCIVPVIHCLDQAFGLDYGVITTIHSAMNDQPVIDAYHNQDLRKTRSAVQSIIPVDTGLAKGIGRILPHLDGRFSAQAMRVPTVNVSAIDLSVTLHRDVDAAAVNGAIREGCSRYPADVLACTDEPLASCDFNHDPRSAIVDLSQTRVSGPRLVKVLVWFDNEWAYANRMLDVAGLIRQLEQG
ncbi:MAG: glyceraldehyde 3-phosphate dehydrogenase NAD-binding domain-containing protein [Pseudohongiellaceae bacterium]